MLVGCATGPPPPLPSPRVQTLNLVVNLNDLARVNTRITTSSGNTYLGFYRIVINSLNTSLIGNQIAVTTSPDTWTDTIELSTSGWSRNHRIASPTSQQPQQWSGFQAITPGTISSSGNSFTVALTLPDQVLGSANLFNASIITYLAPVSNPGDLHPIDSLGPLLSPSTAIDFLTFNAAASNPNTKADSGGTGDWATYPADFPDLQPADYQNYDIRSLTISIQ